MEHSSPNILSHHEYRRGDRVAERLLEPLGLVLKAGTWYLVADVPDDSARRTYRVSRIVSAEVLAERFSRPEKFDLAEWWQESSKAFEKFEMRFPVRARLSPVSLRMLPQVLGREYVAESLVEQALPDESGWIEVRLVMENESIALGQLTTLSPGVEILEPETLRAALAAIGAALAARNAPLDQR
jgi:predicted DNA-binding transcriptional regulator YafY